MKKILLISTVMLLPITAWAQTPEPDSKHAVSFDLDGNGVEDRILLLAEGCDGEDCGVVVLTEQGATHLGYGKAFDTGYISARDMGVEDPENYPADIPVVTIDGVLMAFNGKTAFPVGDMISRGQLTQVAPTSEDLAWLSSRLNVNVMPSAVLKAQGPLLSEIGETVFSVTNEAMGESSAWFIQESNGAEAARGFSLDYPRIYQNESGLRVISTSHSGLGVMDISLPEE